MFADGSSGAMPDGPAPPAAAGSGMAAPLEVLPHQVQPSRWSPTAWSIGTLLHTVNPRPAGGFISVELVAAAAAASRVWDLTLERQTPS